MSGWLAGEGLGDVHDDLLRDCSACEWRCGQGWMGRSVMACSGMGWVASVCSAVHVLIPWTLRNERLNELSHGLRGMSAFICFLSLHLLPFSLSKSSQSHLTSSPSRLSRVTLEAHSPLALSSLRPLRRSFRLNARAPNGKLKAGASLWLPWQPRGPLYLFCCSLTTNTLFFQPPPPALRHPHRRRVHSLRRSLPC